MLRADAIKQFDGKVCVLHSPSWGAYLAQVTITSDRPWRAEGEILAIVGLPAVGKPVLKPGKKMSVGNGGVSEWDGAEAEILSFDQSFQAAFNKQLDTYIKLVNKEMDGWHEVKASANALELSPVSHRNIKRTRLGWARLHKGDNLHTYKCLLKDIATTANKSVAAGHVSAPTCINELHAIIEQIDATFQDMQNTEVGTTVRD